MGITQISASQRGDWIILVPRAGALTMTFMPSTPTADPKLSFGFDGERIMPEFWSFSGQFSSLGRVLMFTL